MAWSHFETIISSSTFTVSGLITSSFGIPVMQRRPLERISSLKSKWILSFSILTQALLSISLQLPLILRGPTEIHCDPECECGNMSPQSKGSSWHVPHNLMWGLSPPGPWYPLSFFIIHAGCIILCGWGVNEASVGQRLSDEVLNYTSSAGWNISLLHPFSCCRFWIIKCSSKTL